MSLGLRLGFVVPTLVSLWSPAWGNPVPSEKIDAFFKAAARQNRYVGLSVVVVNANGQTFAKNYGYQNLAQHEPVTDETIYELGSISKTFTRLLLSLDTALPLDTPLSAVLPPEVVAPRIGGKEIRIQDLALHTGFRFTVPCVKTANGKERCFGYDPNPNAADPYKNVTREQLFKYVSAYSEMVKTSPAQFPRPGKYYEYSNPGMGLLGEILAMRAETSFGALLEQRVLAPLHMKNTYAELNCATLVEQPESQENSQACEHFAKVYNFSLKDHKWHQGTVWHMPGMIGTGGIRSSIKDMTLYLKAQMGMLSMPGSLRAGVERSHMPLPKADADIASNLCGPNDPPEKPCNKTRMAMYLGWPSDDQRTVFFHAGETGASQTMISFSHDKQLGVVILSNSNGGRGHFPNQAARCIFQLAGKMQSPEDACALP